MPIEEFIKNRDELLIIAGPCVIESEEIVFETAERLRTIFGNLNLPFIFKSSYDKSNRTSINSYRGPGIEKGLQTLSDVKSRYSIPVLTDVHSPREAGIAAEVADVLQIPAFLCRQTDLIVAASETGKAVNIKKGQFLAPWDVKNVIDKFISTGNRRLTLTERGVSFGYNNLVVDFRAFPIMKTYGYPVIFDVTHSLQLPGGQGSSSGGQRDFAGALAGAAIAAGADGLFMEVHPDPDKALCDGPNMIKLDEVEAMLKRITKIHRAVKT
ncbi:2-dehydro-3-deoxyphosphooctonate aldolase [bacterium BMS3Abin07]|nr:2-dehydro-3-deoxyphosphooctonate aldolase [bacterium BMS3Abin07]GBE31360.1 2-dehydro-3-deoxyphosphooctonate aldolase [bacterium BMS3Bbin05]HDL20716.1 3-deoxy-8-phosphooctulonate synthase [Nitrospirota bacterium]HDO22357.1 3-deoxy-8-phosphooctulonate synthase [Nitrospirota bacterium]HDZ88413.1 3-deoxy-8-phosphooctulonate synthase [Nitrospirota bacterium]